MTARACVFLLFATLGVGCASLKVEVDVADPAALAQWNSERAVAEILPRVGSEQPGTIKKRVDALRRAKLQDYLTAHATDYANLAHDARQQAIDALEKSFDATVGAFYQYHSDVLESLSTNIHNENTKIVDCEAEHTKWKATTTKPKPPEPICSRTKLVALLLQREQLLGEVQRGPDFVLTEPTVP